MDAKYLSFYIDSVCQKHIKQKHVPGSYRVREEQLDVLHAVQLYTEPVERKSRAAATVL